MEEELKQDAKDLISVAEDKALDVLSVAEKKAKFVTLDQHQEVLDKIQYFSNRVSNAADMASAAADAAKGSASVAYQASVENARTMKGLVVSIDEIKTTLKPISDAWSITVGFGKVTKYIFIGLAFIIGLFISIKNLLPNFRIW